MHFSHTRVVYSTLADSPKRPHMMEGYNAVTLFCNAPKASDWSVRSPYTKSFGVPRVRLRKDTIPHWQQQCNVRLVEETQNTNKYNPIRQKSQKRRPRRQRPSLLNGENSNGGAISTRGMYLHSAEVGRSVNSAQTNEERDGERKAG